MYQCFICHKQLLGYASLKRHFQCLHDTLGLNKFICCTDECLRSFSTLNSLLKHIRHIHVSDQTSEDDVKVAGTDELIDAERNSDDNSDRSDLECLPGSSCEPMCFDNIPSCSNADNSKSNSHERCKFDEISYILGCYASTNLCRSNVQEIVERTKIFCERRYGDFEVFSEIDTEYKLLKKLKELDLYIEPGQYIIDYTETIKKSKSAQVVTMKPISCAYIPLRETFQKVFSIPTILDSALTYMSTKNDALSDVKDAESMRNLPINTFPFVIFFDEIDPGNCLGSHKGESKLGMFYTSLRCFPPHVYSKLNSIFLYMVMPSSAMSNINQINVKIVEDLQDIQNNGIIINDKKYFFRFVGLIGDNLGQHQILGYVRGFTANFPCRSCRAHRDQCRTMVKLDSSLLRNQQNYEEDLLINDSKVTGIMFNSEFNCLDNYHVTRNQLYDIMHDVSEGVSNFGMTAILQYLVGNSVLSLDVLNIRIMVFPFTNKSNRPPAIQMKHLDQNHLAYSAAEMNNLVMYFNLLVGDLIPSSNPAWEYYLVLRKIVDILLLKTLSLSHINQFDSLVSEHHILYQQTFAKPLRPKHHHLLHYKSALLNFGPLCHNWAFRFESKNFETKLFGKVIRSRINLCKSIAIRHMYGFALNILKWRNKNGFEKIDDSGPSFYEEGVGLCYNWIIYEGIRFEAGNVVNIRTIVDSDLLPKFAEIVFIKSCSGDVCFITKYLQTIGYSDHMAAYSVKNTSEVCECFNRSDISSPLVLHLVNDTLFIADVGL